MKSELDSADAMHREQMRRHMDEETRIRQEMQVALQKQLQGEASAELNARAAEYEQQLHHERMASSAKLVQTHRRAQLHTCPSAHGLLHKIWHLTGMLSYTRLQE